MTQRAANKFQSPVLGQVPATPPASLASLYQQRTLSGRGYHAVDELTRRMQRNMTTGEGAAGECKSIFWPLGTSIKALDWR